MLDSNKFHPLSTPEAGAPPILRAKGALDITEFLEMRFALYQALRERTLPSSFLAGPVQNIEWIMNYGIVPWLLERNLDVADMRLADPDTTPPHRDLDYLIMLGRPHNAKGKRTTAIWHGADTSRPPDEVVQWAHHSGMILVINDTLPEGDPNERHHAAGKTGERVPNNSLVRYLAKKRDLELGL